MKIVVAGHEQVLRLLPMSECIAVMEEMFKHLATGEAKIEKRYLIQIPNGSAVLAVMPAFDMSATAAKIMTIYPENSDMHFETHQGAVLLFGPENGRLLAVIDSTSITSIRTAAVSAVATSFLARSDASNLAILGSGAQAASHLQAIPLVRKISSVKIWSRNFKHAISLAQKSETPNVKAVENPEEAVKDADIICTTTSSKLPILEGKWIQEGAHINAIGAYTRDARELDSEAVKRSVLFVDSRESAITEVGDFLIPKLEGVISDSHIKGELCDVVDGKVNGRTNAKQITLFKSVGLSTEDLAAAQIVYSKALSNPEEMSLEFAKERDLR